MSLQLGEILIFRGAPQFASTPEQRTFPPAILPLRGGSGEPKAATDRHALLGEIFLYGLISQGAARRMKTELREARFRRSAPAAEEDSHPVVYNVLRSGAIVLITEDATGGLRTDDEAFNVLEEIFGRRFALRPLDETRVRGF